MNNNDKGSDDSDNNDCINEPYCFADKDGENRKKPLAVTDSIYEHDFADADEQLVVWKLESDRPDGMCNAQLDTAEPDENGASTSSAAEKLLDNEQCTCVHAWLRLKRYLELTDEELKNTYPLSYTFRDDIFRGKRVDFDDDDDDDDYRSRSSDERNPDRLDDFQLDGKYLYARSEDADEYGCVERDVGRSATSSPVEESGGDGGGGACGGGGGRVKAGEQQIGETIDDKGRRSAAGPSRDTAKDRAEVAKDAAKLPDEFVAKDNMENAVVTTAEPVVVTTNNGGKQRKSKIDRTNNNKPYTAGTEKTATTSNNNNTRKERLNDAMEYVYTYGETYRGGIQCGHMYCVDPPITIPVNKGWISEEFKANIRRNKQVFTSDSNLGEQGKPVWRMDGPQRTTWEDDVWLQKTTREDDGPQKTARDVQRIKSNVDRSYAGGHSSTAATADTHNDSGTKEAVGESYRTTNRKTVGGAGSKENGAVPALKFVKKNGTYTVIMNCVTSEGQKDDNTEPVVFRLATRTDVAHADAVSSCDSFEMNCVTPSAFYALRPTKAYTDAHTLCVQDDFSLPEK